MKTNYGGNVMRENALLIILVFLFAAGGTSRADELDLGDDLLGELQAEENESDRALLNNTYFGNLRYWNGVDSNTLSNKEKNRNTIDTLAEAAKPWGWKYNSKTHAIKPIPRIKVPMSALLRIPSNGSYRIFLRRIASTSRPYPVLLTVDLKVKTEFIFGSFPLTRDSSKEQEKSRNILFEDEGVRTTFPAGKCWVWEYLDIDLEKGDRLFKILPLHEDVQISHIFISVSKTFTPRLTRDEFNNLKNVFYRFRVRDAKIKNFEFQSASLKYHWDFKPKGAVESWWGGVGLGQTSFREGKRLLPLSKTGTSSIPIGEWSSWFDATWTTIGAGPWATGNLSLKGVKNGICDIQISWQGNIHTLAKTISAEITNGSVTFCAPLVLGDRGKFDFPDRNNKKGIWGFWGKNYLGYLKTLDGFNQQYLSWIQQARTTMGITHTKTIPAKLKIITSVLGSESEQRTFAKTVLKMGFNGITGVSPKVCKDLGIDPFLMIRPSCGHISGPSDPAWPTITKMHLEKQFADASKKDPEYSKSVKAVFVADEIGNIAGTEKINLSADCLKAFRQYLTITLKNKKKSPEFFGVETVDELEGVESITGYSGVFERRLYSHTVKFREKLTADYYRPILAVCENLYPEAIVFSNFSPVALRQGDQTMNHASWFSQPGKRSVNTAWGEDWSFSSGSWGYGIISYYAALVECAARKHNLKSGFYNVPNCGLAANNIVSILSRNIKNVFSFRFGPAYNGTGIGDNWSDNPGVYPEIIKALHVAGHIGLPLAEGKIEHRGVALLYNRDHEIMNGGSHGEQSNRFLTFAALANANRNADIILNENLTSDTLARYSVLFASGFCLSEPALPVLIEWVKNGGLLIASSGFATRNEYNTLLPEAESLLGATQFNKMVSLGYFTPVTLFRHKPIEQIIVEESELTPSFKADVVGMKFSLMPTTGKPVGRFSDGTCAAVINSIGKGYVLLWGVQPGLLYKGNKRLGPGIFADEMSRYCDDRLAIFEKPLSKVAGQSPLSCNAGQVELTRFNHKSGVGILLNNFKRYAWKSGLPTMAITIKIPEKIGHIESALDGELKWQRNGEWIVIQSQIPESVDSILINYAQ